MKFAFHDQGSFYCMNGPAAIHKPVVRFFAVNYGRQAYKREKI